MTERDLYRETFSRLHASEGTVTEVLNMAHNNETHVTRRIGRRAAAGLIAAAMVLALSVTALAVGIARIVIEEQKTQTTDMDTGEQFPFTEVRFAADGSQPALMGVWAPADLPEGFALTDDFYTLGFAYRTWEAPDGGSLTFQYTTGESDYAAGLMLPEDTGMQRRDVTVNGQTGVLYTLPGTEALFWTDEEQGVGFALTAQAGAEDMDLLPLAESVERTGEAPESSSKTLAAIRELGDWAPADLPAGYHACFDQGTPGSAYGGDFSYVRRFYADGDGQVLELRYETPVNESYGGYVANYRSGLEHPADEPDAVCSVTDTTVQGQPAGLIEYPDGRPLRLVWLAEDGSVAFLLSGSGLTSEELLAVAESVTCTVPGVPPAATVPPVAEAIRDENGVLVTPEPTAEP